MVLKDLKVLFLRDSWYSVYQKCLNDMRLYLAEEEVKKLDGVFGELAGIHLKYMEQDGI